MKGNDDGEGFSFFCLAVGLVIAVVTLVSAEGERFVAGMGLSTTLFTAAGTAHQTTKRQDPPS